MPNFEELYGLSGLRIQFIIECLGEFPLTELGVIRDRYRRAYGEQITAETIQRINNKFPKKVEKARQDFLQSYKKHPLYNRKIIQDNLAKVIELGFELEAYGSKEWDEKDTHTGEVTRKVKVYERIRDLKAVVAANKICLDLIQADERLASGGGEKPTKEQTAQDGLSGLTVVR